MSNHHGPGYWKITNANYIFKVDGDKIRREKVHDLTKKWVAVYMTDNPYANKAPGWFKTHQAALSYALLGGTPIAPEILANLEER